MHVTCTTNNKYWKEKCQPFPGGGGGTQSKQYLNTHPIPHLLLSVVVRMVGTVSHPKLCVTISIKKHIHTHIIFHPCHFPNHSLERGGGRERERKRRRESEGETKRQRSQRYSSPTKRLLYAVSADHCTSVAPANNITPTSLTLGNCGWYSTGPSSDDTLLFFPSYLSLPLLST